ncbi:MAG: porin [Deltaproteobacteria bacterium]|nr:porin [Deltaproteobacteria bacterium]
MKLPKLVKLAFCIVNFLILLFGFCGVAGAADQQTVERLQQLIEQQQAQLKAQQQALEAQTKALEDLKIRVEALTKEEAAVEEKAAEAERLATEAAKTAPVAKAEADKPAREVEGIDLRKYEERRQHKESTSFQLPDTETAVTISGYTKLSVIHDFDKIESPTKFITSKIVVDGQPSGVPSSRTVLTANASRFIIGTATPTDYGKLTTLISVDFMGNSDSTTPDLRLRQAWGKLDDFFWGGSLKAGQAWSTMEDVSALPETMDFQGPNGSNQNRQPLIRWNRDFGDKYSLWLAAEDPASNIENGDGRTRWPDGVMALQYKGGWGHLKSGLILRPIIGEPDSGGGDDSQLGGGATLAGVINLPILGEKDNFKGRFTYGRGLGSYENESGVPDGVMDGDELNLLPLFAGYGALQHWWSDSWRSNAVFGWLRVYNRKGQTDTSLQRTLYSALNLVWSPIQQMDIGGEVLWGQRNNKNGADGHATRIQFSTRYVF